MIRKLSNSPHSKVRLLNTDTCEANCVKKKPSSSSLRKQLCWWDILDGRSQCSLHRNSQQYEATLPDFLIMFAIRKYFSRVTRRSKSTKLELMAINILGVHIFSFTSGLRATSNLLWVPTSSQHPKRSKSHQIKLLYITASERANIALHKYVWLVLIPDDVGRGFRSGRNFHTKCLRVKLDLERVSSSFLYFHFNDNEKIVHMFQFNVSSAQKKHQVREKETLMFYSE